MAASLLLYSPTSLATPCVIVLIFFPFSVAAIIFCYHQFALHSWFTPVYPYDSSSSAPSQIRSGVSTVVLCIACLPYIPTPHLSLGWLSHPTIPLEVSPSFYVASHPISLAYSVLLLRNRFSLDLCGNIDVAGTYAIVRMGGEDMFQAVPLENCLMSPLDLFRDTMTDLFQQL